MKKRIFSMLLSLCIIAASITCISAQDAQELRTEKALKTQEELYTEKQGESLTTYFAVKDELSSDKETYGGVYIDDNGNLNIMIVNPPQDTLSPENAQTDAKLISDYQSIIAEQKTEEQSIIYHLVPYTLEHLETVQDNLMDHAEELNIVSSYIDEIKNIIVVGYSAENFDENSVIDFVGKSNMLAFEKIVSIENDATIKNGSQVNSSSGSFSIACGAKLGNDYGFITAAHCGSVGTAVYYNGSYLGDITHRRYGGNVDVAFIKRNSSSYLSTTKFTDSTAYTAGIGKFGVGATHVLGGWPTGATVVMYGATTGRSTGKILTTNYSGTFSGNYFEKLVKTSCKSQPGDSGGAVKAIITYNGLTSTYCAGVNKGHITMSDGTIQEIYTDMGYAKSSLGFVGHYDTTGVK